jgi:hypothetical protein
MKFVVLDYCPLRPMWAGALSRHAQVDRLQRARSAYRRATQPLPKRLAMEAFTLAWPVTAAFLALRNAAQARQDGRGSLTTIARRAVGAWWLASTRGIGVDHYDDYDFDRADRRRDAEAYTSMIPMTHFCTLNAFGLDPDLLDDKTRFERHCHKLGLPVACSLCTFVAGERFDEAQHIEENDAPDFDLVLKSANGVGGREVEAWYRTDAGDFENSAGDTLDWPGVLARGATLSVRTRDTWLLQRRIVNHERLRSIAPRGLSTIRVVTILERDGSAAHTLCATLRVPGGLELTDNFSGGGLAAALDLDTGRLNAGVAKVKGSPRHTHHPATGEPIAGRTVPMWEAARKLAERAHLAMPESVCVGWDVVVTDDGPLLLEANSNWGATHMQKSHDSAILLTEFADVALESYRRWKIGKPALDLVGRPETAKPVASVEAKPVSRRVVHKKMARQRTRA